MRFSDPPRFCEPETLDRLIRRLGLAIPAALAVFIALPGLDTALARLFHVPGAGFPAGESRVLGEARDLIVTASWLMAAAALASLLAGALIRRWTAGAMGRTVGGIPTRIWGFVVTLYLTGPALVVDWLLKGHWARPRPADVAEFGGSLAFMRAGIPGGDCLRNCSFVSGDVAGATALGIALAVLAGHRPGLAPRWRRRLLWLAAALPAAAAAHRIAAGRHFLSDAVLAMLITAGLGALLARVMVADDAPARRARERAIRALATALATARVLAGRRILGRRGPERR